MERIVRFKCPACGKTLGAAADRAGSQIRCPAKNCVATVVVPYDLDDAPALPPTAEPAPGRVGRWLRAAAVVLGLGLLAVGVAGGSWLLATRNRPQRPPADAVEVGPETPAAPVAPNPDDPHPPVLPDPAPTTPAPPPPGGTPPPEPPPPLPPLRPAPADPLGERVASARAAHRAAVARAGTNTAERRKAGEEFAAVLDDAVAGYERAGAPAARVGPLRAELKEARHADLIGFWGRTWIPAQGVRPAAREFWLIGVDRRTGDWKVMGCIQGARGFQPAPIFDGTGVRFEGGALRMTVRIRSKHRAPWPDGTELVFRPGDGRLVYTSPSFPGSSATFDPSTDETRSSLIYWGGGGTAFQELAEDTGPIDPADPEAVWAALGRLVSFPYYAADGETLSPLPERLYLPSRGMTLSSGRGFEAAASALQTRFDQLATAHDPYLRAAAREGRMLFRERYRLGLVNSRFGNTPDASFTQFGAYLGNWHARAREFIEARDRDRAGADRDDPPLSPESRARLLKLVEAADNQRLFERVADAAALTTRLAYADMAAADRAAALWQDRLVPLAKLTAGPAAGAPLVTVEGGWQTGGTRGRLNHYGLRAADRDLTRAVVELVAENPWGERATHYYYLPELRAGTRLMLAPHPRWRRNRIEFTNTVRVTYSVWADQGTSLGMATTLENPKPHPDPEAARRELLRAEPAFLRDGEVLGLVVRSTALD
ncbi:MAG: hypothetical protein U0804_09075 [Gemmataceae bacterium]